MTPPHFLPFLHPREMLMRIFFLLAVVAVLGARAEEAVAEAPVVAWNITHLEAVRERLHQNDAALTPALERLRLDADKSIEGPPAAVTEKVVDATAPSQDPHDFVSSSTYHWPDEKDPQAPWVWKDGQFNQPMIDRYDYTRLKRMTARVTDGTLAWWFTGETRYADAAVQQLRVWFIAKETRMNPHLEFAQFIPNKDGNRGHPYGIIDARNLVPMLSAVALLEKGTLLPVEDRTALRAWFRAYLTWLTESRLGQEEGKATNNHSIFYDQQVIACAAFIGDQQRLQEVLGQFAQRRMAGQIEPDGSMVRELNRADGATYATFNLTALTQVMVMGKSCGVDLWAWTSSDGRSLAKATQWFYPFLQGTAWAHSGTFQARKLTDALVMIGSVTGDPEATAQARALDKDVASRRKLLFPLMAGTP